MSYKAGSKSFSVQVPTHTEYITEYLGGGGQNSPVRTRHRAVEVADKDYLDVNVDLYVDDAPFNESARDCRNSVTELTGSVAAMNAAQVATIKKSGEKISQTIVGGFYNMVKSEISQQLAEMYSKFEALLARINSISKLVAVQKETMERDYSRISRQYLELFDGLDEALNRRIRSLDAPAFEANAAGKNALAQRFIKSGVAGTLISLRKRIRPTRSSWKFLRCAAASRRPSSVSRPYSTRKGNTRVTCRRLSMENRRSKRTLPMFRSWV